MSLFDLSGRAVIVTGAARGIGAAAAEALTAAGARVLLADSNGSRVAERAAGLAGAVAATVDVTNPADMTRMADQALAAFGRIDILVCSAGVTAPLVIEDTTLEDWNRVLAVNLTGTFLACQAAVAAMRRQGQGGRIVLIGSQVSHQGALMGHVAYAATKGGVVAFAKTLARSTAADRITVNVVAPGLTDTEMLRGAHPPEEIASIAARIPLGLGSVEDIAAAIVYLASDAARHITGATIDINGGMVMR